MHLAFDGFNPVEQIEQPAASEQEWQELIAHVYSASDSLHIIETLGMV